MLQAGLQPGVRAAHAEALLLLQLLLAVRTARLSLADPWAPELHLPLVCTLWPSSTQQPGWREWRGLPAAEAMLPAAASSPWPQAASGPPANSLIELSRVRDKMCC